jgi:CHAT domain-containing protein/cytochrome c-type biogenesis protein CcmH/NrfG
VSKPGEKHLNDDELDKLAGLSAPIHLEVTEVVEPDPQSAEHLSWCPSCRHELDKRIEANWKLANLRAPATPGESEHCPTDEELMNLAAGLADNDASRIMLEHAASCDRCGPALKRITGDFADSTSAEESRLVAESSTSSPQWERQMSARLSGSAAVEENRPFVFAGILRWRWPAFAAATVALAFIMWTLVQTPERRTQNLLAQAYADRRNMELRIPDAQFAPIRVERGQQASHLSSPSALLDAESLINRNLAKHPEDPVWLQNRARAELLEGNYSSAIDALQNALATKPNSSSVLIDLGTAYAQRGEATTHPEDLGQAVELFSRALRSSPNDRIALFNRAVVSARLSLYTQAIEDWENYLRIDATGKWADEVRSRLEEIKQKKDQRNGSSSKPLLTLPEFAQLNLEDQTTVAMVDGRFESYAPVALSDWLAEAYPVTPAPEHKTSTARSALSKIARVALLSQSDRWWTDFLEGATSPSFPEASKSLASAVAANEAGDTRAALFNAQRALELFRLAGGNEAGILRAEEEALYARNTDQDAKSCASALSAIEDAIHRRSYRWLEIEFQIQKGNCLWLGENLGEARSAYSLAASKAADAPYTAILLGAQDHLSMAQGASGDYASAWRTISQGLDRFWNGNFPDVRGYNFYYSMSEIARFRHERFLERVVWKDAILLTESSPDLAQRAVAHSLVGNVALEIDDPSVAFAEFDQSARLFARSPQVESTRLARFEAETRLADIETLLGRSQNAISRLHAIEPEVTPLSDNYLKILYYDNLGRALLRDGQTSGAESSLNSAVRIAELQLASAGDSGNRITWKAKTSETYRDLVALIFSRGDVEGALDLWESYKAAPARNSVHPRDGASEVQPRLRDIVAYTVVTYAVLPEELLVWVYDERGVNSYHAKIATADLVEQATQFRGLCANPKSNLGATREQGRRLYDQLIAPIERYLTHDRTLVVELDDSLNGLPVEALVDSEFHYLGARSPVLSSLGLLYASPSLVRPHITAGTSALVVAVPSPHIAGVVVEPLPDVVAEAELVAKHFQKAELLTETRGTLRATLDAIPNSDLFHFAGHSGYFPKTGLALSDALLSASAFEQNSLGKMRLAVLSACDTQDAAPETFESSEGLVAYFLRAQVPRVVASRWRVDSGSTRRFMNQFYDELVATSSVESAMFKAQRVLRDQPETAHPYYWAAFSEFGLLSGD